MAGEPGSAAKLQNILDEECIPGAAEGLFFSELENLLTPPAWPTPINAVTHGKAAAALAVLAVRGVAPALYCQGPALNGSAGFSKLARLRSAKNYHNYLPARERDAFLASINKSDVEVENASASELRQWIENHLRTYSGDLNLSHRKGVAWVTDSDQLGSPAPSLSEAADALGLHDLRTEPAGILFRYERTKVGQQHLPRSLDALENPPFAMKTDCNLPHGTTRRISTGADGLPEAIHPGCNLAKTEFINLEILT